MLPVRLAGMMSLLMILILPVSPSVSQSVSQSSVSILKIELPIEQISNLIPGDLKSE